MTEDHKAVKTVLVSSFHSLLNRAGLGSVRREVSSKSVPSIKNTSMWASFQTKNKSYIIKLILFLKAEQSQSCMKVADVTH